jgi:tetratricopeptide (TPR) repeat protein
MNNLRSTGFSLLFLIVAAFSLPGVCAAAQGADSFFRKGIELASEGEFAQAKNELTEAVKENKSDFSAQGALQALNDFFSKKISQDYVLALFKSMRDLHAGEMTQAIEGLQRAISLDANYPKAYNVLGVIYASQGETEKAVENLKKSIEADAGYAGGYYNLASVYQSLGKADEAIDNFRRYVELNPSAVDGRINLSLAYASKENYEEAIGQCREAVKIDPECADAYFNIGLSYFMLDEYVKSKENLIVAQELYRKQDNEKGLESVKVYLDKFAEVEEKAKASLDKTKQKTDGQVQGK